MNIHRQLLSLVGLWLAAGLSSAAPTNVALGGRFITDGAWSQGATTVPCDGSTADWSGPQAGGGAGGNRLFGVRLPGLSTVDSFQLFITDQGQTRKRPKTVRVYYQGGSADVSLPNSNAVVSLPQAVRTPWLVMRELTLWESTTQWDGNYFLNEIEAYDSSNTPVDTGGWANRIRSTPTGTPGVAAVVDGNYSQGGFFPLVENGSAVTFSAAVDRTAPLMGLGMLQDFADSSNLDRVAWNMARELTVSFNDPASSSFTFTNLNATLANNATYDQAIPAWYQVLNFPTPVIGATQVTVSMLRQDPENTYGPGPLTPTLPISTRKTWGLAQSDNNRWGMIEFEILSLPEPTSALLLGLAGAAVLSRRRRSA